MTETLRSITNSGIWIPMLAPTCSSMMSSDEPRCRGFNQSCIQFPLSFGMLLARDSIVGIPIPCSISLPASLFYSFCNTSSHDQLFGHIELIMMMSYRVGPEIPLRLHGVTNPNLDSCQPNRHFRRYPQCTFIATQLRCDVWYTQSIPTVSGSCTISWSKEMILDIRKALAYELHDLVLGLGLGLVHHIILLMM